MQLSLIEVVVLKKHLAYGQVRGALCSQGREIDHLFLSLLKQTLLALALEVLVVEEEFFFRHLYQCVVQVSRETVQHEVLLEFKVVCAQGLHV